MNPSSRRLLLQGQRVLVTGAGRGIGQAIAVLCHEQGAKVAICARTASQLSETAALMHEKDGDNESSSCKSETVSMHTLDVTKPAQVQEMVQTIVQEFGGIDILINNAGRGQAKKGPLTDLDTEDFASLLNLNVVALHTMTAACVPHMNQDAQVINISSKAGKQGLPQMSHYVASKFAVEGLTAAWAADLKSQGIRVNSISPGMVNTASFPKPDGRPGVRTAASIADGLWFLLTGTKVTGHYLHVDELDMVRAKDLPDERALKPIDEPNFADTL